MCLNILKKNTQGLGRLYIHSEPTLLGGFEQLHHYDSIFREISNNVHIKVYAYCSVICTYKYRVQIRIYLHVNTYMRCT